MVAVYYWRVKPNFGDLLTPLLLKRFSNVETSWARPETARLALAGSILDQFPDEWDGIIAGAGKLHEKTQRTFPNAKVLAVRGPLTAKGLNRKPLLADPGLLADELVRRPNKEYNLGIIPHWTDNTLEFDSRFTKYDPKIIRVGDDPLEVIREIGRCKKVVSSSLHGIIVADAFCIPRRIEIAPRMISHAHQEGGLFKWYDYSASIGMKLEIGKTQTPSEFIIQEKQHALYDMFKELKKMVR